MADLTDGEKIELARTCIDALNARDFDRYFSCFEPGFVIRTPPGWEGDEVAAGRAELTRFYEMFFERWDNVSYQFLEGPEVVEGKVFSKDRWCGCPKSGGPEESIEFYSVATFGERFVVAVDMFLDREQALEFARPDG